MTSMASAEGPAGRASGGGQGAKPHLKLNAFLLSQDTNLTNYNVHAAL